jgi:hypothetical protein
MAFLYSFQFNQSLHLYKFNALEVYSLEYFYNCKIRGYGVTALVKVVKCTYDTVA